VAAVLSLLSAFFIPASGALRPQLLPAKHLVRGNSLFLIGLRGGQAVGSPIGAALMGFGGVMLVAATNAVSFVVSALAVLFIRTPARTAPAGAAVVRPAADAESLFRRIGQGLRHVVHHPRLRLVLIVIGLTELSSAGPLNIGVVMYARRAHAEAAAAGWLLTAFTVGATVSFVVTLVWPARHRAGTIMVVGILGQAVALLTLAFTHSVGWGIAAYAVIGLVSGLVGIVLVSLVQRWSDASVRGRVMSIQALFVYSAAPIGNFTIGVLIAVFGFPATLLGHAALSFAAVAIVVAAASLRSARLG
jgi:predicted MFS family arabinose efflux permease